MYGNSFCKTRPLVVVDTDGDNKGIDTSNQLGCSVGGY